VCVCVSFVCVCLLTTLLSFPPPALRCSLQVRIYECKLRGFGIPAEELSLRQTIGTGAAAETATAPADLIVV
jgi:hypothetical protein